MGFAQNEQTDRNMGINQNEQTKMWILNIANRVKFGYWQGRTDHNMGLAQTEQTVG